MKKRNIPQTNKLVRQAVLIFLSGVLSTQTALGALTVRETPRFSNVDSIEQLIHKIQAQSQSEAEQNLARNIGDILESQLVNEPSKDEQRLTLSERVLLAKILATVTYHTVVGVVNKINPLKVVGVDVGNLKDLSEKELSSGEASILKFFASLVNRNALAPYLKHKLDLLAKVPVLGKGFAEDPKKADLIVQFAVSNINGLVKTRGMTNDSRKVIYEPWAKIVSRQKKAILKNEIPRYETVGRGFVDDFSYLVDGPQSFAKRKEILERAKYNIDILVWAIQDDMTGDWIKEILIRKKQQGVKVRVIVDGDVAKRPKYGARVEELRSAGIEIIKWVHPEIQFVGQHRKMIVVDGVEMIAGGLNFGDTYSHLNAKTNHWRDTDLYAVGPFVSQVALKYFDEIWNDAAVRSGVAKITARRLGEARSMQTKNIAMEIVDHSPEKSQGKDSNIYNAILADIMTARKTIDIANAYIIVTDAFVTAIKQAVDRGVRVRLITNSDASVDEPTLAGAMMISAKKLKAVGAEVYLRKGTTLHSKFMVVDSERSHIMSYNLHPRSERMEGEVDFIITDKEQGKKLVDIFEQDTQNPEIAKKVVSADEIKLKNDVLTWLLIRIMYDQL